MRRRSFLKQGTLLAGAAIGGEVLSAAGKEGRGLPSRAATLPDLPGDTLCQDDFSALPAGWLSHPVGQLNGAIQEVHYIAERSKPFGVWENALCHQDAWVAGDEDGKSYLEQHLVNDRSAYSSPVMVTGDPEWTDYTVTALVRPLSLAEMAGVVFRYATNHHYHLFVLTGGNKARLAVRLPLEEGYRVARWRELGSAPFDYDVTKAYELKVEALGPRIRAFVDGKGLLELQDAELLKGRVGVIANIPARFYSFRVTTTPETKHQIARNIRSRSDELARLRAENPQPKLLRKFATPGFGAGRSVRFGELDGDGKPDMLIAQNVPRVSGDGFDQISCLTAVTLEGRALWQLGRPAAGNGLLTNDLPFQIHDIDGDGRNEVVMIQDFKLQIRDGATGKLRQWVWMPDAAGPRRPYKLENGDAVAFLNLSGNPARHEILVKDRYTNFWVFDNRLELLWHGRGQTGHFPYPFDVDGDGRDELLIGYALWDHDGRQLWSRDDEMKDHVDSVVMGNFTGDPSAEPLAYYCCSDEGVLVLDRRGKTLKQVRIGHAQNACVAKFRPQMPGLQYMTVNFWYNPGIVTLFSPAGDILAQAEPSHSGSPLLPVNWRGDGQEFALLSGNVREGGMLDGELRRVVVFPDDGHPDLCAYAAPLTGGPLDDVVLWDQESVWIYGPDRQPAGKRVYAPVRNPAYNDSNYRASVSLPGWMDRVS